MPNRVIEFVTSSAENGERLLATYSMPSVKALGIVAGGLLSECYESVPQQISLSHLLSVRKLLPHLCADDRAAVLLSTPAKELSPFDIRVLFSIIAVLARKEVLGTSEVGADTARGEAIGFIRRCKRPLSNGEQIRAVQYLSGRKLVRSSDKALISDLPDSSLQGDLARPISTLEFSDLQDLKTKAAQHLVARLERITEACAQQMNEFTQCRARSILEQSMNLPADAPKPKGFGTMRYFMDGEDPELARMLILKKICDTQCYKFDAFPLFASGAKRADFLVEIFPETQSGKSGKRSWQWAFAGYYLPGDTVIACFIAILLVTGWNLQSLISLTRGRVSVVKKHQRIVAYRLLGIKGRTNSLQGANREISQSDDPVAFSAVTLLLTNNDNARQWWDPSTDRLFVELLGAGRAKRGCSRVTKKAVGFYPIKARSGLQRFCERHSLPAFTTKQIRDQVANAAYAKTDDVYLVKSLLEHLNVSTTEAYLNTHLLARINDANMNLFMRQLASSTIFSIRPELMDKIEGVGESTVNKKLLFPTADHEPFRECLADEWITCIDAGENPSELIIGVEEARFCARQRLYYRSRHRELHRSNPSRFIKYHLPRIIFCLGLYEVIRQSEFRRFLGDIE